MADRISRLGGFCYFLLLADAYMADLSRRTPHYFAISRSVFFIYRSTFGRTSKNELELDQLDIESSIQFAARLSITRIRDDNVRRHLLL